MNPAMDWRADHWEGDVLWGRNGKFGKIRWYDGWMAYDAGGQLLASFLTKRQAVAFLEERLLSSLAEEALTGGK